ncbi:DUF559 domain-containing protein [Demequina lignilytica]|uniref:DUF559 domain-containing protein n=1 Tax=Demequina lignilytica TaxID=3051663 RepID=A0AB35MI80_9MICO|nr:DUF559 domain-containing protein [Demequina sp. SYSU T0a273]MDN4483484.1 DUF559 domain-containing protein [Demequina sp. SYSU T0a273]
MGTHRALVARLTDEVDRMRRGRIAAPRGALLRVLGRRLLERAVESGVLVRLLPGVYAPADLATDHRVLCHAVTLASRGRAIIAGRSALHLVNDAYPAPRVVQVIVDPSSHAPRAPWIQARRIPAPGPAWTLRRCRVLTPPDAVVDAWARAPVERRRAVLYDALWLRCAAPAAIAEASSGRGKVPQRAELLAILGEFIDGAQSPGEVMARREVFRHRRYDEFERQVPVVGDGRGRPVDMLHRRARLAVEIDSEAYHGAPEDVARDHARDVELSALGYQTVRYRFRDLRDRPEWCRRTLDRIVAVRLRDLA